MAIHRDSRILAVFWWVQKPKVGSPTNEVETVHAPSSSSIVPLQTPGACFEECNAGGTGHLVGLITSLQVRLL